MQLQTKIKTFTFFIGKAINSLYSSNKKTASAIPDAVVRPNQQLPIGLFSLTVVQGLRADTPSARDYLKN